MASSLINFFRLKKQKGIGEGGDLNRKGGRQSVRCCSPIPTWRSEKEAIYISGASWTRPSAPYSVITAPKKNKQTRSCPGGVSHPPFKPLLSSQQQAVNNSKGVATLPDDKGTYPEVKTSEYGSADPSPTDCSQTVVTPVPDSDHESDYIIRIQKYEFEIRKLRKRMKDERHYFKEQYALFQKDREHMRRYIEKACRATSQAQKSLEYEKKKNQSLRKQLYESEVIIIDLQNQLKSSRYREMERVGNVCCMSCRSSTIGAGEALCALTHSEANLFDSPSAANFDDDADEKKEAAVGVASPRASTPVYDCKDHDAVVGSVKRLKGRGRISRRSPLKRSYSDSELPSTITVNDAEDGTSLSSDDDSTNVHLIGKQLRRRGEVVRFVPPRRTVRQSTFRRYGRKEKSAMAEFDYLQDMTTDASAIATSSDYSSSENRLKVLEDMNPTGILERHGHRMRCK